MKNILLVESSPRGSNSYSHQAARSMVNEIHKRYPSAQIVVRDLAQNPPPHVGQGFITGMYIPPERRAPEQAEAISFSDVLIDELFAADTIVIALSMHNFGVPSALKAWVDHVARAGRTYSFTSNGPEGFLKGKRVILVIASGGVYSTGPMTKFDFTEPYLRTFLGFLGITDVQTVRVEGTAVSAIGPEKALATAAERSRQILEQAA